MSSFKTWTAISAGILLSSLTSCSSPFSEPEEAPAARELLEEVDAKNPNFLVPIDLPKDHFLIAYGVNDGSTTLYFSASRKLGSEEIELCVDRKESPSCTTDRSVVSSQDTGEIRAFWRAPRKTKEKAEDFLSPWKDLELTAQWKMVDWLNR